MMIEFMQIGTLIGGVLVLKLANQNKLFWYQVFERNYQIICYLYQDYKESRELSKKLKKLL